MVLQTQFADIKGNDLYIDGIKASDLAKQYGTPLYVMSEGHIRHQMNELKTKFMDKYEKALPLFASKSFSCLAIYKLASEYGIGIDCVSAGEISIALRAGFDPDKIYFHGNNKLPSEIEYALSHHEKGDMIAIIGKGNEDYNDVNGVKTHFSDREAVDEAVKKYHLENS